MDQRISTARTWMLAQTLLQCIYQVPGLARVLEVRYLPVFWEPLRHIPASSPLQQL